MEHKVLLVENNRIMLERLSSVIRAKPDFELIMRCQKPQDALRQGRVFETSLVLLDIEPEENRAMLPEFVRTFPHAAIVGLGNRWEAARSREVIEAGAQGCMTKPFTADDLTNLTETLQHGSSVRDAEVLTFFSPKGKSGKTTLIANLAMSLARKSGESVGIIDADLQFGDMAVFFNLQPKSTIAEVVRDVRFLSPYTLRSYFVPVTERVNVLCGTARPDYAELVQPKDFHTIVDMARTLFRYVLLDIAPGFGPIQIESAELSEHTFLVAMINDGFEIQHMKRALEIFKDWEDYEDRVHALFTRVSPCDSASQQNLSHALGYPVEAVLPNEYMLVSNAANNGRMAVDIKPTSPLTHNIDKLVDRLRGRKRIRWDKP